jgi:hypothetical protein
MEQQIRPVLQYDPDTHSFKTLQVIVLGQSLQTQAILPLLLLWVLRHFDIDFSHAAPAIDLQCFPPPTSFSLPTWTRGTRNSTFELR